MREWNLERWFWVTEAKNKPWRNFTESLRNTLGWNERIGWRPPVEKKCFYIPQDIPQDKPAPVIEEQPGEAAPASERHIATTIPISVAIFDQCTAAFKHWAVFLPRPGDSNHKLFHVTGYEGNFEYDPQTKNAQASKSLIELVDMYRVAPEKAEQVEAAASEVPVRNHVKAWNCQDYVLDLLEALEIRKIINRHDTDYKKKKAYVLRKQEGLA